MSPVEASAPTRKQEALWLLERLVPDSGVNNLSVVFKVDGRRSASTVERTIALLLRRYEVLRTVFYANETGLTKRTLGPDEITVVLAAITPDSSSDAALHEFIARPFEMEGQPLVRAGMLSAPDGDVCCVAIHHLIFDTLSAPILLWNFVAIYDAIAAGQEPPSSLLEVVPAAVEPPPNEQGLAFWREHLAGFDPSSLNLGIGKRDIYRPTLVGGQLNRTLDAQVTAAVRGLQRQLRAPESVILFAAFYLLLNTHGAGRDLVVGSPVSTRRKGDEGVIGYHVSVAPLRARIDPEMSFRQLAVQVRNNFLTALGHSTVSLDDFFAELPRSSSSWRDTIMRHLFNYVSGPASQPFAIGGMKAEPVTVENGFSKFDLEFFVASAPDGIWIRAVYYEEILAADDVRLMLERYEELLRTLAADVERPLGELPVWFERAEPMAGRPSAAEPAAAYHGELVGELVALWRQLLGRDDLDEHSNFFISGGHSVLAAQLAQKIGELTGVRPKLADVFALPTPVELAGFLDSKQRKTAQ
jgi:hypothetical protein